MSFFSDKGFYQLSELYHWALYTGIAAVLLIVASIAILVWSLLRSKKTWKISVIAAFCVCLGIWSLFITLAAFQQLAAFGDQLLRPRPHHITPGAIRTILGATYGSDVQRCQIQFGISVAVFIFLIVFSFWRLIHPSHER